MTAYDEHMVLVFQLKPKVPRAPYFLQLSFVYLGYAWVNFMLVNLWRNMTINEKINKNSNYMGSSVLHIYLNIFHISHLPVSVEYRYPIVRI